MRCRLSSAQRRLFGRGKLRPGEAPNLSPRGGRQPPRPPPVSASHRPSGPPTASWQAVPEWRDPDSNRGHHDFQSCSPMPQVRPIYGEYPADRTMPGSPAFRGFCVRFSGVTADGGTRRPFRRNSLDELARRPPNTRLNNLLGSYNSSRSLASGGSIPARPKRSNIARSPSVIRSLDAEARGCDRTDPGSVRLLGAHDLEVLVDEDVVRPVDADDVDVVLAVAQPHDTVDGAT